MIILNSVGFMCELAIRALFIPLWMFFGFVWICIRSLRGVFCLGRKVGGLFFGLVFIGAFVWMHDQPVWFMAILVVEWILVGLLFAGMYIQSRTESVLGRIRNFIVYGF